MTKAFVYQIYYDAASRARLLPGFIPLDNTRNERPDWYEFWVILSFLRANALEDGAWYGFLSPRFQEKTGFDDEFVLPFLQQADESDNVALFTNGWDQLAFFLNPWEQGEVWHPGVRALSQAFLDKIGLDVDLGTLVTDLSTSVFCNYVVAKREFWIAWQQIAEKFFAFAEGGDHGGAFSRATSYGYGAGSASMKTFIQERFASLLLATGNFNALVPDQSQWATIFTAIFADDPHTRRLLKSCDLFKSRYRQKQDASDLEMYWKTRRDIRYTPPPLAVP